MTESVERVSVSLYPDHLEAIEARARQLGLRGANTRSPALQSIIDDWKQLRGITPPSPAIVNASPNALTPYPPTATRPAEATTLIAAIAEQSDLPDVVGEDDTDEDVCDHCEGEGVTAGGYFSDDNTEPCGKCYGTGRRYASDPNDITDEYTPLSPRPNFLRDLPINPFDEMGNLKFPHVDETGKPYPPHLQPITVSDIEFSPGRLCRFAMCSSPATHGNWCQEHNPKK